LPEKMVSQHPSSFVVLSLSYKTAAACLLPLEHICSQHRHRHLRRAGDEPLLERGRGGRQCRTYPRDNMGAEAEHPPPSSLRASKEAAPAVLGLQLSALVDHVACVDWSLLDRIPGDRGGSQQVLPQYEPLRSSDTAQPRANDYCYNSHHLTSSARAHSVLTIPIQPDNGPSLGFKLQSRRDHFLSSFFAGHVIPGSHVRQYCNGLICRGSNLRFI
jgi:hypothetical protein